MITKKYTVISFLLLLVLLAGCQNDNGGTPGEETGNESTDSENAGDEATEDEASEETAAENGGTSGETDAETVDEVVETAEEVDSYEAVVDLSGEVDNSPYTLNAEVAFKDGDPPELLLKSNDEARTVAKNGAIYIYSGDEWVDTTESINIESLFLVTYDSTINSFENLSGSLTQEETDDEYLFTYEGTNQTVYQEFESLLGFGFGAMDTSDVHSDLTFTVNKDNHLLKSIDYEASGEDEEGEYALAGDVEFTNFNNVDEIELPEEVE